MGLVRRVCGKSASLTVVYLSSQRYLHKHLAFEMPNMLLWLSACPRGTLTTTLHLRCPTTCHGGRARIKGKQPRSGDDWVMHEKLSGRTFGRA